MPKTLAICDIRVIYSWKTQKLLFFLLSDWILEMETTPSVAQYTWQPIKYKKSFSTRNGDTRFWRKNSDDMTFFHPNFKMTDSIIFCTVWIKLYTQKSNNNSKTLYVHIGFSWSVQYMRYIQLYIALTQQLILITTLI